MRRSLITIQLLLLALVVVSTVGCRKLLAGLGKGDDAGVDASAIVAAADPGASASATTTASAPSATAATTAVVAKAAPKGVAKKAVPRCPAGQGLFAEGDTSPIFCSRSCDKDADCKPAKCNQNLFGADETGTIFVGVGKQVFACDKGFGPPAAASASGASGRPFGSASAAASGSARPGSRRP